MDKNAAETSPGASAVTAEKVENTVIQIKYNYSFEFPPKSDKVP